MESPTHCYLGVKACGCFGFIGGDEPSLAKDIAKSTKWIIRNGGLVERLPLEEGKARVAYLHHGCAACSKPDDRSTGGRQLSLGGA
jgi:hypothetical protein